MDSSSQVNLIWRTYWYSKLLTQYCNLLICVFIGYSCTRYFLQNWVEWILAATYFEAAENQAVIPDSRVYINTNNTNKYCTGSYVSRIDTREGLEIRAQYLSL